MKGIEFPVKEGSDKTTLALAINENFCRAIAGACPLLDVVPQICYGVKVHKVKDIAYAVLAEELDKPTFEEHAACKDVEHILTVESPAH